jgi:hypothetical protein
MECDFGDRPEALAGGGGLEETRTGFCAEASLKMLRRYYFKTTNSFLKGESTFLLLKKG